MLLYIDADGLAVHAVETLVDGTDVNGSNYLLVMDNKETEVNFRRGLNVLGLTNEALLKILLHRLTTLDEKLPCEENKKAFDHIQNALTELSNREQRLRPHVAFCS